MGTMEEFFLIVHGLMTTRMDDFLPNLLLVQGMIMVMVVVTWGGIVGIAEIGCEDATYGHGCVCCLLNGE